MTNNNIIIEQVTQYLSGKLSAAEKAAFEARIEDNLPLQQEIAFQVAQRKMMAEKSAALARAAQEQFVPPANTPIFLTRRNLGKIAAMLIMGLLIGLPMGKHFFSTQEIVHEIVKVSVPSDSLHQILLTEKNKALQTLQHEKDSLTSALAVVSQEKENKQKELLTMETQALQQNKALSTANFQKYQAARQEVERMHHELLQQISENIAFHNYNVSRLEALKVCKRAIGEYGFAGNKGLKYKVTEDIFLQNRLKETTTLEIPADDKSCTAAITTLQSLALTHKQALADAIARESLVAQETRELEADLKKCEGEK